jgi:hypothetical protein
MLESGTFGSVRGVPGNGHPYRNPRPFADTRDGLLSRSGDHGSLRSHRSPDESSGGAHGAIGHTVQFTDAQARWPRPVVANRLTHDIVVCIIHT